MMSAALPAQQGKSIMRFLVQTMALFVCALASTIALAAGLPRFGQAELETLLRHDPRTGKPVDSVEALLPLLPRELRANFTLVYDSRSRSDPASAPAVRG